VDCPTCGRSIRVPNLDGTVAPLPKPAIDLRDHSLATALDQLAALEQGVPNTAPIESPATKLLQAAPVVAEPVVVAPLQPVVPEESDAAVAPFAPRSQPWVEVEEQLATLAEPASKAAATPHRAAVVTRRDVLVAATTAAVIGPVTWWLTRSRPTSVVQNASEVARPAVVPPPVAESTPALTGRITYVTAEGESRPDAGARVLLLPESREGSTLLSVDGFRSHAAAADLQLARETMKLHGGAYVVADEQGRYGADLPSSGTYELLIISNYQSRPAGPLPGDLLKSLGRYFERPQLLIGQTAYEFAHFRFTGREPAVRDQVFQRA
ncbi:MAG TPA: hypothetical protein VM510_00990, partial [Caulifigura sp.]|nr:hypothetical protein [Caulifigura sp.]